jgi:hypothetical protein
MNYLSVGRRPPKKPKEFKLWHMFVEIKNTVSLVYDFMIGIPLLVLNQLGINLLPNIIAVNTFCSFCLCGAFLGITASVGIGLTCAKSADMNTFNNTNSTIFNTTVTSLLNTTRANG